MSDERFVPSNDHEDGEEGRTWSVIDEANEYVVGGAMVEYTEAEAHVIAFALNSVADRGRLQCAHLGWPDPIVIPYTGPTEGVAPR